MHNGDDSLARRLGRAVLTVLLASALTLAIFLILPLLQAINPPPVADLALRDVSVVEEEEEPPEMEEPEAEEEPEPEEPPQLEEQVQPLDLSQLEVALEPSFGDGTFGDFAAQIVEQIGAGAGAGGAGDIFALGQLDSRPRAIFKRAPRYPPNLRGRSARVEVLFLVDTTGRVARAKAVESSDAAFDRYAVEAVEQWKFEPGTRDGKKVQFKMKVPIQFDAPA